MFLIVFVYLFNAGGTPNISLMTGAKFTQGFTGIVYGFELQESRRLDLGTKARGGINVKPCYRWVFCLKSFYISESV